MYFSAHLCQVVLDPRGYSGGFTEIGLTLGTLGRLRGDETLMLTLNVERH